MSAISGIFHYQRWGTKSTPYISGSIKFYHWWVIESVDLGTTWYGWVVLCRCGPEINELTTSVEKLFSYKGI